MVEGKEGVGPPTSMNSGFLWPMRPPRAIPQECPSLMRGAIASFSTKRVRDYPLPGAPTIDVSHHSTSEFIQMSCCSRKMMVASKYTRNYTSSDQSPTSNLRERSNACFSVECSKVLTMGYACKKSGRGRRVERTAQMKS
jgi:hypothetical protein